MNKKLSIFLMLLSFFVIGLLPASSFAFTDILPVMTANNAPSPYVISATGEYNTSHKAYMACDDDTTTNWMNASPTNDFIINLGAGNGEAVTQIALTCGDSTQAPSMFFIKGSADNNNYYTLSTQSSLTWTTNERKVFIFSNSSAYQYYKLQIQGTPGGSNCSLREVELSLADPVLQSISISPQTKTLATEETQQLTATATYSDNSTGNVTSSTTWVSSNTSIATVSSSGLVTGVSAGTTTITATYQGLSGTSTITVTNSVTLSSISVTPSSSSIQVGNTTNLTATATFSDSSTQNVTPDATWTSSNEAVATVANGVVTAVSAGTATITATYQGETATSTVTVTSPASNNRALLVVTMTNGLEREYDLSSSELDAFLDWYDDRAGGTGTPTYAINKNYSQGPFVSRKDYLIFDKILIFEVNEYEE